MYLKESINVMLESTPIAYAIHKIIYNGKGSIEGYKTIDYNESFLTLIGVNTKKPKAKQINSFIYTIKKEIPQAKEAILKTIVKNENTLVLGYTPSYNKWLKFNFFPTENNSFIAQITDITKEKELENKLIQRSQELELILNSINDIVLVVDFNQVIVNVNNAGEKLLGYEPSEVIGKHINEFISKDTCGKILQKFKDGSLFQPSYTLRTNIAKKEGSFRTIEWKSSVYGNYVYSVGRDITDIVKTQEAILYLSYHDKLTGLYNRAFFEEELKRLDNDRYLPLSIIMGDVNGLKIINDVFGHLAGDRLLKNISDILSSSIRKGDILSRWGGDEFIILLPNTSEEVTKSIVNRIKDKCKNHQINLHFGDISLGYSIKKYIDINMMNVVTEAESHMYKNKVIDGRKTRHNILSHMMEYLYNKNFENKSQVRQIKHYLILMAKELKLSQEYTSKLLILADYHDIGLVSVSNKILNKKEKLTKADWKEIKNHPETGYRIAKAIPELSHVADHILYHHELWNGSGYPKGLKEKEIPYLNRIFSIVDVYNALTNDRPYRPSLGTKESITLLKKTKGFFFDPELVDLFLKILKNEKSENI